MILESVQPGKQGASYIGANSYPADGPVDGLEILPVALPGRTYTTLIQYITDKLGHRPGTAASVKLSPSL